MNKDALNCIALALNKTKTFISFPYNKLTPHLATSLLNFKHGYDSPLYEFKKLKIKGFS